MINNNNLFLGVVGGGRGEGEGRWAEYLEPCPDTVDIPRTELLCPLPVEIIKLDEI